MGTACLRCRVREGAAVCAGWQPGMRHPSPRRHAPLLRLVRHGELLLMRLHHALRMQMRRLLLLLLLLLHVADLHLQRQPPQHCQMHAQV